MTILEFYFSMTMGLAEPQIRDLGWLIKETLSMDVNDWAYTEITDAQVADLARKADRIFNDEPLAHVLGYADFYWCKIFVNKDVLIPRPETEELCDKILNEVEVKNAKVLDMCTGSGCIAVALAKERPEWQVTAADISPEAIEIAKKNAVENEVNVQFVQSDMWQNIEGKFDCIVSNPPYICSKDIESLPESVRNFEPYKALDGGEDGLDFYRDIAANAPKYLNDNGYLFLEIGDTQGEQVASLLGENFQNIRVKRDIFGKHRYVLARKK